MNTFEYQRYANNGFSTRRPSTSVSGERPDWLVLALTALIGWGAC